MKQLALDLSLGTEPTLDSYVAGPNAEALQALRDVAAGACREPVVYLFGPPGSGRTHLLRGVVNAAQCTGTRAVYCAGDFPVATLNALPALVAWDDVHLAGEASQATLFGLQIRLQEPGGTLVAAGDQAPARLALRADVVTRLAAGVAYPLHVLADEDKAQAVARHAAQRGFRLGHDVIDYLLSRHARDLPALIRMLEALDRYSLATKRPVTVLLLRELLADAES